MFLCTCKATCIFWHNVYSREHSIHVDVYEGALITIPQFVLPQVLPFMGKVAAVAVPALFSLVHVRAKVLQDALPRHYIPPLFQAPPYV